METFTTILQILGALAFGVVVGWIAYFILRRAQTSAWSDLATIIGTLAGATILALFDPKGAMFGAYAIGLAVGFFAYYFAYKKIMGVSAIREALQQDKDHGVLEIK
jgi:uncharacterized membrane protein YeaQ/YmgE (transglycosylase-associated protein family)